MEGHLRYGTAQHELPLHVYQMPNSEGSQAITAHAGWECGVVNTVTRYTLNHDG